jgi:hypothetical protein
MGQRQSNLSRVSTVLGLVLDLLGLVMGATITLAVRTVAPSAKSAPMCWRSRLYRGVAHRLQRCRCATYWQARSRLGTLSARFWTGEDAHTREPVACTCNLSPLPRMPSWPTGQIERCCCKAEPMAAFRAHGCNDQDALETFSAIDCSTAEEKAPCGVSYPLPSQASPCWAS